MKIIAICFLHCCLHLMSACSDKGSPDEGSHGRELINVIREEPTRLRFVVNDDTAEVIAYTACEEILGDGIIISVEKYPLKVERSVSFDTLGSNAEVIVDFSAPKSVYFNGDRFFTGADDLYLVSSGLEAITDQSFKKLTKKIESVYGIEIEPILNSDGVIIGPGCIGIRGTFDNSEKIVKSMIIVFIPILTGGSERQ